MTAEWDCKGCGRHIVGIINDAPPDDGLCAGCSNLGPVRYKAFQDWQDGIISEYALRQIFERAPPYVPPE